MSGIFSKLLQNKNGGKPSSLIPGLKTGKSRQYAVLGVIGVALYIGMYLIFATSGDNKPKQQTVDQQKVVTTHITAAGEQVDPRDRWIGTAGNKVAEHDSRLTQQEQQTKDLMSKFTALQDDLRAKSMNGVPPISVSPVAAAVQPSAPVVVPPLKPAVPTSQSVQQQPFQSSSQGVGAGLSAASTVKGGGGEIYGGEDPVVAEIGHIRLTGSGKPVSPANSGKSVQPGSAANGGTGVAKESERMSGRTFLPVGFVKSKLLGGIYAPTGGQAQSNPMPVILRLKDLAVLPNQFRANVRDCMVVGASYGDLSAERAYVRTELLSCVRNNGQAIEVKAQGTVYDSDGKLGLRGRLISKQDKILMNALIAGVVGGIGQGVQNLSSTTTVTPFGNTIAQPDAGKEFKAGIGSGVGRALDRLANYQISLAEKVFPVIEVDSGREVDVAFTKGIDLPVPLPELETGGGDED